MNSIDEALVLDAGLADLGLRRVSTKKDENYFFVDYSKPARGGSIVVSFFYGAPEWDIDFNVIFPEKKMEFKDVLAFPELMAWAQSNRGGAKALSSQIALAVRFFHFALPFLEAKSRSARL